MTPKMIIKNINEFYGQTRVGKAETLRGLKEVQDEVDTLVEMLESEIEEDERDGV